MPIAKRTPVYRVMSLSIQRRSAEYIYPSFFSNVFSSSSRVSSNSPISVIILSYTSSLPSWGTNSSGSDWWLDISLSHLENQDHVPFSSGFAYMASTFLMCGSRSGAVRSNLKMVFDSKDSDVSASWFIPLLSFLNAYQTSY